MSSSQARPQGLPLGGGDLGIQGSSPLAWGEASCSCASGTGARPMATLRGEGGSPRGPDTMPPAPRAPRPYWPRQPSTCPGKRRKRAVSRDTAVGTPAGTRLQPGSQHGTHSAGLPHPRRETRRPAGTGPCAHATPSLRCPWLRTRVPCGQKLGVAGPCALLQGEAGSPSPSPPDVGSATPPTARAAPGQPATQQAARRRASRRGRAQGSGAPSQVRETRCGGRRRARTPTPPPAPCAQAPTLCQALSRARAPEVELSGDAGTGAAADTDGASPAPRRSPPAVRPAPNRPRGARPQPRGWGTPALTASRPRGGRVRWGPGRLCGTPGSLCPGLSGPAGARRTAEPFSGVSVRAPWQPAVPGGTGWPPQRPVAEWVPSHCWSQEGSSGSQWLDEPFGRWTDRRLRGLQGAGCDVPGPPRPPSHSTTSPPRS